MGGLIADKVVNVVTGHQRNGSPGQGGQENEGKSRQRPPFIAEEVAHQPHEDRFFHDFPPSKLAVNRSVNCWDW